MTFAEKFAMEHPGDERPYCPFHVGYEECPTDEECLHRRTCEACWNREISGTEQAAISLLDAMLAEPTIRLKNMLITQFCPGDFLNCDRPDYCTDGLDLGRCEQCWKRLCGKEVSG